MKSPRFDIRAAKLRKIFTKNNIERIWKEKVRVSMREQLVNDGIEDFDFHVERHLESAKLSRLILSGHYVPQKAQRILVEKSKGLCRQLVIPSVRDAIVLQCLSDALYSEIKGKAPTKCSFFEPKDHSFSSIPSEYGTFASWLNFQKALFKFSKTRNFIVVTDIANYYDTISYVHLRNALASLSDVDECIIDMLIFVLSDLLWQPDYTPRIEVGLPQINLDAPRLLAHCFLYELDAYLASDSSRDFVRYMDDIDVGVDTVVAAKKVLRSIDLVLQTKQVRLNSGKTSILSQAEAIKHFRILENLRLDRLKAGVERRTKVGLPVKRQARLIERRIRRGISRKLFDNGNGEKILKRWISLAVAADAKIPPDILEKIVRQRPATRLNVYNYIRSRALIPSVAKALAGCATSGLLVDDAAMVELCNHLVETQVPRKNCQSAIHEIIVSNNSEDYYGLYSTLWLQSKYSSLKELLKTISSRRHVWVSHDRLGRLVGSFLPLFRGSPEHAAFKLLISRSLNAGARATYKFHVRLASDADTFKSMFDALKNPNPSRGTGITHAKFLCLLSALSNPSAPAVKKAVLKTNNAAAFKDAYYRSIAKRLGV